MAAMVAIPLIDIAGFEQRNKKKCPLEARRLREGSGEVGIPPCGFSFRQNFLLE